jgi:hypothetical protein
VVLADLGAGVGGEVRQLGQGQVDLDHAAAGLPALDVGDEVGRQLGAVQLLQEGDLRVLKRLLPRAAPGVPQLVGT